MQSLKNSLRRLEDSVAGIALLVMAVLPILEAVLRATLGFGIPASMPIPPRAHTSATSTEEEKR